MHLKINYSGKEAINFLPADGPAKDLAMKGLGAAQAVKDGKSLTNVVGEGWLLTINTDIWNQTIDNLWMWM